MNISKKILLTCISIICTYFSHAGNIYCQTTSSNMTESTRPFAVRVTKENFTEIHDSLTLPDFQNNLTLDPLFFKNLNITSGSFSSHELLSFEKDKYSAKILSNKIIETNIDEQDDINVSHSQIYNVSLKNGGSLNNNLIMDNPVKSYSSIYIASVDNKSAHFEELVETSKHLIHEGNFSKASEILKEAVSQANTNSWNLANAAKIFEKINQIDDASSVYQKAVSLNPNRIELLYNYSLCLMKNNQLNKAEQVLKKITRINPEFTLAYYNLGNIYSRQGQYYKALDVFNKAAMINPLSPDIQYNIALILETLHQKKLAFKYYKNCLKLAPEDLQARKAIQRLYKT